MVNKETDKKRGSGPTPPPEYRQPPPDKDTIAWFKKMRREDAEFCRKPEGA